MSKNQQHTTVHVDISIWCDFQTLDNLIRRRALTNKNWNYYAFYKYYGECKRALAQTQSQRAADWFVNKGPPMKYWSNDITRIFTFNQHLVCLLLSCHNHLELNEITTNAMFILCALCRTINNILCNWSCGRTTLIVFCRGPQSSIGNRIRWNAGKLNAAAHVKRSPSKWWLYHPLTESIWEKQNQNREINTRTAIQGNSISVVLRCVRSTQIKL